MSSTSVMSSSPESYRPVCLFMRLLIVCLLTARLLYSYVFSSFNSSITRFSSSTYNLSFCTSFSFFPDENKSFFVFAIDSTPRYSSPRPLSLFLLSFTFFFYFEKKLVRNCFFSPPPWTEVSFAFGGLPARFNIFFFPLMLI